MMLREDFVRDSDGEENDETYMELSGLDRRHQVPLSVHHRVRSPQKSDRSKNICEKPLNVHAACVRKADLLEGISKRADDNDKIVPGDEDSVNTAPFDLIHSALCCNYFPCLEFGKGSLKIRRHDQ